MTPEFPPNNPRAELEARLTAFILGELPAHDAAALRQTIDDDAELAQLYERLSAAHKLVREAVASPAGSAKESATPLRLSEARRQKLIEQFKTVAPKEFALQKKPARGFRLIELAAVVAIVGILAGLMLPALSRSKMKARSTAIYSELRQINAAKQQWAGENHKSPEDVPTASDLAPYLGRGDNRLSKSFAGETYNIGKVGESPSALVPAPGGSGQGVRRMSLSGESVSSKQVDTLSGGKEAVEIVRRDLSESITLPAPPPGSASPQPTGVINVTKSSTPVPVKPELLGAVEVPLAKRSPTKTTIVLPPMDNSGRPDTTLTWNTYDGSTQPPVVMRRDNGAASGGPGQSQQPYVAGNGVVQPPASGLVMNGWNGGDGNGRVAQSAPVQNGGVISKDTAETKVFRLKNGDPEQMAGLVSNLFPDDGRTDANTVKAIADPRTGSITISANKDLMPQIGSIVGTLDENPRRKQQVHYYDLNSADVQDVQRVMQDLFPAGGSPSSQNAALTSRNTTFQSQQNSSAANPSGTSSSPFGFSSRFAGGASTSVTNSVSTGPQSLGLAANNGWNFQTNDPDWIGYLGHPDQRHSASNLFLSRGSFTAIPQGDHLDAESIHNQTPQLAALQNDGSLDDSFQPGQRPPVYIPYKPNSGFRFYQDSNGNGVVDANGTLPPPNVNIAAKFAEVTPQDNATLTFDDANKYTKYRQLNQFDNGAVPGSDYAQPNYIATNGTIDVLTVPKIAAESGRTAKLESPRAAGASGGSSMRQDASLMADNGQNFTYAVVNGKLVPTPAPNNDFHFGTVPSVTGTYFGGINGQAAQSFGTPTNYQVTAAQTGAGVFASPDFTTGNGRGATVLKSPRAAESSQYFSGIGAINNGVVQNPQLFVETTPSSSYAAVQRQPAGIGSSPKGEFPGAAGGVDSAYVSTNGVLEFATNAVINLSGRESAAPTLEATAVANDGQIMFTNLASASQPAGAWSLSASTNGFDFDKSPTSLVANGWRTSESADRLEPRAKPLNGATPQPQPVVKPSDSGWTDKVHNTAGNIGVADGSVQQVTVNGYRGFANHQPNENANVLLMPGDEEAVGSPTAVAKPASGQHTSEFNDRLKSLGLKSQGIGSGGQAASTDKVSQLGDMPLIGALGRPNSNAKPTAEPVVPAGEVDFATIPANESLPTNVTVTIDPETKQLIVSTNYVTAQNIATDEAGRRQAVKIPLKDLDRQIKQQEEKVDGLRKQLNLVDTDPQSTQPGSSLGPVNVLHYNNLKIEAETQYQKQEELLKKLQELSPEELKQTIPTASPDAILSQLLQDEIATETLLVKLKNDLGTNHPDVERAEKLLAEYNKQIDGRVKGIVEGIDISAKSLKAQIQNLEERLNEARTNDIGVREQTRPYYEAEEKLAKLRKAQEQLAQNQKQQIPIQYAKTSDISGALKTLGADKEEDGHSQAYREKYAELEQLRKAQEITALRAAQESSEIKMPIAPRMEIIEHADGKPAQNPGLGQRIGQMFTGKVTQTARIRPEMDVTDVPGVQGQPNFSEVYDPHFIQNEFEVIQSEKVLDQVIDKLKLDQAWATQKGSTVPLSRSETRTLLKKNLEVASEKNTSLVDIKVKSDKPEEAARIANTIAEVYQDYRKQQREELIEGGMKAYKVQLAEQQKKIAQVEDELDVLRKTEKVVDEDVPVVKHSTNAPIPQPEVSSAENAFSTFSLNISDVSLKLAAASLEKGQMPDASTIRSEEFINAFDYRDPEPAPGAPLGFAWERAQYPFAHNRDLLRFAVKTAATGRDPSRPLNIVLLLDKSGSMERADRVRIIHEALRVLATQLQPQDKISVVTFARVARLWVDGLSGSQAAQVADGLDQLTPEGGTNLEEAMRLAYETARRHYLANGINRVVLLTDGAANLGNVDPDALKVKAEEHRKEGIALDCFGVGWEGYNDDLLEVLSRNGGGRYGFINTPEEAATDFVGQLAGALNVAAYDVKVQVEFNPRRVTNWRQIGYAKHQLTIEQFRDNTVKAAQIAAAESGNGLYAIEINPSGEGPVATVRVRYRVPGTEDYPEHEYQVPYTGGVLPLEQSSPAMRLMGSASAFSEWLASSPFAGEVTTDKLLGLMSGVPETYGADQRPKKLEWMIRQAKSLEGK